SRPSSAATKLSAAIGRPQTWNRAALPFASLRQLGTTQAQRRHHGGTRNAYRSSKPDCWEVSRSDLRVERLYVYLQQRGCLTHGEHWTRGRSFNFRDNVSVGHVRSLQRFLAPLEVPLAREVLYLKIDRVLQE